MLGRKTFGFGRLQGKVVLGLIFGFGPLLTQASSAPGPSEEMYAQEAGRPQMVIGYGKLPMSFEANQGQTHDHVKFLSRGRGYALFLTATEAVLALQRVAPQKKQWRMPRLRPEEEAEGSRAVAPTVLRMQLIGANPAPQVVGLDELPGKSSYFIGSDAANWHTNISTYARVAYKDVYPGIDLVFYGTQGQLEYDFVVGPGANPTVITLGFQGAEELTFDHVGNLIIKIPEGEIVQHAPVIYQEAGGSRQEIRGGYVLRGEGLVGFTVAAYDASKPVVIDPVILSYSTYLGGSGTEFINGIAVDARGNAYVMGITQSTDFPTASPLQAANAGGFFDVFVSKLNPAGSALVYSTYLGGSGFESVGSIAVDPAGNAYVAGFTGSTDFPTARPLQAALNGPRDAFVTKLNPAGSALVYSTYLGGSRIDFGTDIAADPAGNAYLTGFTNSNDFPTVNALQPTRGGRRDAFVAKLNRTGSALIFSTYLGGSGFEFGPGIAVDPARNVYVTGSTQSSDFPTANAIQPAVGGGTCFNFLGNPRPCSDGFVAKFNATGSSLVYSTYLGGSDDEEIFGGVAADPAGNAYVTGLTRSTDLPTESPLQAALNGPRDAFVTKLNPAGSALVYFTYLGGSNSDGGSSIAVDPAGNAYVAGSTRSDDFPTVNPFQGIRAGEFDVTVTKLNPAGSALVYSTYLGGSDFDEESGITLDPARNAYVVGNTTSVDFPTANPLQAAHAGGPFDAFFDAFVTKLVETPPPAQAIQELIEHVIALNIQQGLSNRLDRKLEVAVWALDELNENNKMAAIHWLEAFINTVEAQRGVHIPETDADALIAAARSIIALLGDT